MSTLLAHTTLVRPLLSEFVGSIAADGQTTRVAAIALSTQGKAVLLNLVANDTTLSAMTARFFKGEQLLFRVADGMAWSAPNRSATARSRPRFRTPARRIFWSFRTPPISARG